MSQPDGTFLVSVGTTVMSVMGFLVLSFQISTYVDREKENNNNICNINIIYGRCPKQSRF